MPIGAMELGRAVRRWTHSDAGCAVIDETEGQGGGWGDGGCWILSDALASGFGLELYGVFGHHAPGIDPTPSLHHVVVRVGNGFIDQDGYQKDATFRRNYLKWEGIAFDSIEPVDRARLEQTQFPRPSMQSAIIEGIGATAKNLKPRHDKMRRTL
jgi:hypothetical protein